MDLRKSASCRKRSSTSRSSTARDPIDLSYVVLDNAVSPSIRGKYLERMSDNLVVNSKGKEKLKKDWPEIWKEFAFE